jgi:hypothetical protein
MQNLYCNKLAVKEIHEVKKNFVSQARHLAARTYVRKI